MELESVLEILGLNISDIPISNKNYINLYINYGKDPLAKLYLKRDKFKFKLRFGYDVLSTTIVEPLPSGGIRTTPIKLQSVQR